MFGHVLYLDVSLFYISQTAASGSAPYSSAHCSILSSAIALIHSIIRNDSTLYASFVSVYLKGKGRECVAGCEIQLRTSSAKTWD